MAGVAVAVLDGGLATELEARGHDLSGTLWSARLLRDDPTAIRDVHEAFFRAGASVAITASYQASVDGFVAQGIEAVEARALIRRSVALAREAAAVVQAEDPTRSPLFVAASVGPFGASRADGSEYRGDYGVDDATLRAFHGERLDLLLAEKPDLLAVETIPSGAEAAVLAGLLRERPDAHTWVSFQCRDEASLADGTPLEDAVSEVAAVASVVAVGVNCVPPALVEPLLGRARRVTSLPLVAYPNDGRVWDAVGRAWQGSGGVTDGAAVARWVSLGARYVGGCCGVRPDAIAQLAGLARRAATV